MPQARRCSSWHARSSSAPWTSRTVTADPVTAWAMEPSINYDVIFGTSVSKWIVLAALAVLLWVARGVLPPFIVAGILAYVLYPLVDELAAFSGGRRPLVALALFAVVLLLIGWLAWVCR